MRDCICSINSGNEKHSHHAAGYRVTGFAFKKKDLAIIEPDEEMVDEKKIMTSLHPRAKEMFLKFINTIEKGGYTVFLTSGYRSFQKQKELRDQFEAGKIPAAARPGFSYHNYGLAIDLNLVRNGKRYGLRTPKEDWIRTGVPEVATRMGLRWGGAFRTRDNVHFDYPIYTTAVLLEKAKKQFGSIEKAKGNELNLA